MKMLSSSFHSLPSVWLLCISTVHSVVVPWWSAVRAVVVSRYLSAPLIPECLLDVSRPYRLDGRDPWRERESKNVVFLSVILDALPKPTNDITYSIDLFP